MAINSVDDFLNHGSRTRKLNKWKEKGLVDTWNHTQCLPIARWKHGNIPQMVVLEDKQTKEDMTRVWGGNWVCHEDERFLAQREQYKRYRDGVCETEPHYCPICRLADVVFEIVQAGRLDWLEPVFRFEGDVAQETKVLHAGGMWMNRKAHEDLDPKQIKRLRDLKLNSRDMCWQEPILAKCDYVCRVVDNDHPEAGVQIAEIAMSLGDSIKDVIREAMEQRGDDDSPDYGNPFKLPYAIRWKYDKDADINKMYKAVPMPKLALTPAISSAIYGEPPDITKMVQPFSVLEMRTFLEAHALIELPWDRIFDVKKRPQEEPLFTKPKAVQQKAAPAKPKPKAEPEEEPRPSRAVKQKTRAPFPSDDDDKAVACEVCEKAMWEDDTTCPHCDARYTASGKLIPKVEEPPLAPRRMRKRGEPAEAPTEPHQATKEAPEERAAPEVPAQRPKAAVTPFPVSQGASREPGDDTDDIALEGDDDPLPF
jgi:hypothetical protein